MMAHHRKRYVETLIKKAATLSPIVGVLGHRQVGKTTVMETLCKSYCTLDQKNLLHLSNEDPEQFIKENSTTLQGIDECQLSPPLFPALKEHVRKNKKPGQFLLSGSVRFTSRKAIQESLTGRVINFELLPLSISEMAHLNLPTTIDTVMGHQGIDRVCQSIESTMKNRPSLQKELQYYLRNGGLPGICFINNEKLRDLKIKEQLLTILDRDIKSVYPTTLSLNQIFDFVQFIAKSQGQNFNFTEAFKNCKITMPTQKKLLYALEAVYFIRRIPIKGNMKGQIYYLEDQAESNYLLDNRADEQSQYEQLIYRNLRTQMYYKIGHSFQENHFENRGGARIPYVIEQHGHRLGIISMQSESPSLSERSTAASFLKNYDSARILYLHRGKKIEPVDARSLRAPITMFV